eukprot:3941517-Rhodomonas_salina.4
MVYRQWYHDDVEYVAWDRGTAYACTAHRTAEQHSLRHHTAHCLGSQLSRFSMGCTTRGRMSY